MLEGVMLAWFALTALSVLFVAFDIRGTPANPVLKAGFILLTLYAGPFGALLYVVGYRQRTPAGHASFVAALAPNTRLDHAFASPGTASASWLVR